MKKITLFAFAVAALSLASCKKDRVCECTTVTTPATGAATTTTDEITVKKAKKGAVKDGSCQGYTSQTTAPVAGTKTDVTCKLK